MVVMPNNAPAIKREAAESMGAEIVFVGPAAWNARPGRRNLRRSMAMSLCPHLTMRRSSLARARWAWRFWRICRSRNRVGARWRRRNAQRRGTAIKLSKPSAKVIGVEPELAADAQASLRSGKIVQSSAQQPADHRRRIANAEYRCYQFRTYQRYVDDILTVSEHEIRQATQWLATNPKTVAEPSGAVAVAGFLFHQDQLPKLP